MIVLDPEATVAGALERLFLAETRSPALLHYDTDESLRAMRYMRRVIENRLNSHNPIYGARRGAQTEIDVVRDDTQFRGFGKYPILPTKMDKNILDCLRIANATNDSRAPDYAAFVSNALLAANEAAPPPEANVPNNLVGWRTGNRGSPGPNYIFAGTVQGNDFYSVLKIEPAHPSQARHPHRH